MVSSAVIEAAHETLNCLRLIALRFELGAKLKRHRFNMFVSEAKERKLLRLGDEQLMF